MQAGHEGFRSPRQLVFLVPEQFVETRREVGFVGHQVPVPDAVVATAHREIEAFFAVLERFFCFLPPPHHAVRQKNADRNQGARCGKVDPQQQGFGSARSLTQSSCELIGQAREPRVNFKEAVAKRAQNRRVGVPSADQRIQLVRGNREFADQPVPFCPQVDYGRHVIDAAETAEQHDQPGNVVRVIAAFDKALPRDGVIWIRFLQFEPGLLIPKRHRYGLVVSAKVRLGLGLGVAQQVKDRLLLPFRPQALALGIGAGRHQDVHAL